MKELSTEEKAQAYDEAIERAKGAHNSAKSDKENGVTDKITEYTIQLTETIFPELNESEDERIRKAIINVFASHKEYENFFGASVKDILAWLEKQGEHANFRSKIQIGDKVTRNDSCVLVNLSQFERVAKKAEKQCKKVEPIEGFNTEFERQVSCLIASAINKEHEYNEGYVKWTANALLEYAKCELEKQAGRKSSWSEEEEKNIDRIIDTILCAKSNRNGIPKALYTDEILDELVDWLKFLRPQNRWKPSNEQIQALVYVFNHYIPNATDKSAWNALQTIELMLGQLLREE